MEWIKWIQYCGMITIMIAMLISKSESSSYFSNHPGTLSVHENYDSQNFLWYVRARCYISYECGYDCTYCGYRASIWGSSWCVYYVYQYCAQTCWIYVDCDICSLTSNPSYVFQMHGSYWVTKRSCNSPGCGPTCATYNTGCINAGESYTGTVACWRTSYTNMYHNGYTTSSFTMVVTSNTAPTFYFQDGNTINVYSSTSTGTTVNRMIASDSDSYIDSGSIYYSLYSGPGGSYIYGNTLFGLVGNGYITVTNDLSIEFHNVFEMVLTVYDRRQDTTTGTLTISLWACYERPTCYAQSGTFWDTHGSYTGHGASDTMFSMVSGVNYPEPSSHFTRFRSTWSQLTWSPSWSPSHTYITQNYYTGEIYSTGNVSIFPEYPSKSFSVLVTVGNTESCHYTSTCQIDFTVYYTNWAIEIRNSPTTYSVNEDYMLEYMVHRLEVFDYNYYWEDNATCVIDSISPHENNLFKMRNENNGDGTHAVNSFEIWRLACSDPACGWKNSSYGAFLCPLNSGCFNHNITQKYTITFTCSDAYGSSDTSYIDLNIIKNEAPVYSTLPTTVILDTDTLAHYDIIFSIPYTDNEDEDLIFEYTYAPDYGWIIGDDWGNYFDNLGNLTMTTFLWNSTVNDTHYVTICGHERRNEICDTLTIDFRTNCGLTPTCSDQTGAATTEFGVGGTVFTVIVTSAHTSCTHSILSDKSGFFTVDENTGEVTTLKALETEGNAQTTYTIVNYISHSGSCLYGSCTYTLTVDPVNYPISIDNLDATVTVHEETTAKTDLLLLVTSDASPDDDVICEITSITPTAGDPPYFFLEETYSGSNEFKIVLREHPGFSSSVTQYQVTVACNDGWDTPSSDTGVLTVDITLNQAPVLTNLDYAMTLDPFSVYAGKLIYTVSVTDNENDDITYTCSVTSTFIPLECDSTQTNYILMRRAVDIVTENNAQYDITVCIGDAKHPSSSCGTLQVTFTSSVSYPLINNLPASISIAEDIPTGTSIFTVGVTDADVGDTHTFTLYAVDPADSIAEFYINPSTGVVYTNEAFDFESQTSFTLSFKVRDQSLETDAIWDLSVTVTNVNEAPSLSCEAENSAITFAEDEEVGTVFDPSCTCTDPDVGDTLTYSISGANSSAFSVFPNSGRFQLATEWDLELAAFDLSSTLTIACTDSQGLSATVQVSIEVTAVNEFCPQLTVSYPLGSTPSISADTDLTSRFLMITATDNDAFDDGKFLMDVLKPDSSNSNSKASNYFYVRYLDTGATATEGGANGALQLRKTPDFTSNGSMVVTVKVSDGETPECITGVTLTVTYTASEQTVEGKEEKCVTCSSNGRILIAVCCIEGVLVALLVGHVVWNFVFRKDRVSRPNLNNNRGRSRGRSAGSTISGSRFHQLGPGNSGFNRAAAAGLSGAAAAAGGAAGATAGQAAQSNSNGRSIEVSDDDFSGSSGDSGSDDSGPASPRPNSNQGPGRTNFTRSPAGLPSPVYAANANANSGLPSPVYSSNTPVSAISGPNPSSRVSGNLPSRGPSNPFSNPGAFTPHYA